MKLVSIAFIVLFAQACTLMPAYQVNTRTYCEKHPYFDMFVCPDGEVYDARQYEFNNVQWLREQSRRNRQP